MSGLVTQSKSRNRPRVVSAASDQLATVHSRAPGACRNSRPKGHVGVTGTNNLAAHRRLDLYAKCCVDPVNAARSITADMHARDQAQFRLPGSARNWLIWV